MDKKEYKKALTDLRNEYIDYKKDLDDELGIIMKLSFIAQLSYLDYVTFNMITSDNRFKNFLGHIIAYKIFNKRTTRDLIDISTNYYEKFEITNKELKRSNIEFNKICSAIDFLNSIDDKELEKYLSYKIN